MATVPQHFLTEEQKQYYSEQGYVIVPGLIGDEQVEAIKKRGRELALGDVPEEFSRLVVKDVRVFNGDYTPDDPEKGLWKINQPDRFDETFRQFGETPQLLDVMESIIGPDIKVFLTMWIYKPPNLHSVHHYHQDSYYFHFGPHDEIMGCWVPFDQVDKDNGTISVIPGSHKLGLLPHEIPEEDKVNAKIFGVEGYDDDPREVMVNLNPGDALFFHSRLLHKTHSNVTDRHRRVITLHAASASCQVMPLQENQSVMPDPHVIYPFRLVRGSEHAGCI